MRKRLTIVSCDKTPQLIFDFSGDNAVQVPVKCFSRNVGQRYTVEEMKETAMSFEKWAVRKGDSLGAVYEAYWVSRQLSLVKYYMSNYRDGFVLVKAGCPLSAAISGKF